MSNSKIKHPQLENDKIKPVGEIISRLFLTHQATIFHASQISKSTKKVKKLYFWTNFKQFPHFLPSPYFGPKFQILLRPLSGHYRSYISQNFTFKTHAYPKLSRKNLRGVDYPSLGMRRVKRFQNGTWDQECFLDDQNSYVAKCVPISTIFSQNFNWF